LRFPLVSAAATPSPMYMLPDTQRWPLTKRGLAQIGRIVPVLASPVVAYLNNRDLQRAGEAAVRFYGTIRQLPRRRAAATS